MFVKGQFHSKETLIYSVYYAPRGRQRLYMLGSELSQRYLYPTDLLIGIIGAEGAGKSTLIQGLFPGLHLTNDDEGVNTVPAPIYDFDENNFFSGHTFHIDVRFEMAFKQPYEIAEAVKYVVNHGRRAIVEHFDLLYESLGFNAQVIFGIGEEVIVSRPNVFGPYPQNIKAIVDKTAKYRFMAHSAEDITSYILEKKYNHKPASLHSDVKHGFVINFQQKPSIDIQKLENEIQDIIENNYLIKPIGEDKIQIGDMEIGCTGIRSHVKSTSDIENFKLLKELLYDPMTDEHLLVGIVGKKEVAGFEDIAEVMNLPESYF